MKKKLQHQWWMLNFFLMNSVVKTLNFCSPTIEKVLYSNTTSVGRKGGWRADVKRNIPRSCLKGG